MIWRKEPLDDLLFTVDMRREVPPARASSYNQAIRESLDNLAALLDYNQSNAKKRNLRDAYFSYPVLYGAGKLPPEDLQRAQQLFWRVVRERGSGSVPIQEELFRIIAVAFNPSITTPFLVEILDFSQPHDAFAGKRRRIALAALALLAIQTNDAACYTALQQAVQHTNPEVRGMAAGYLARAYRDAERPFPPAVQQLLHTIATTDQAFLPRYKARMHLDRVHMSVPLDHPEGVFLFKVKFRYAKRIYRTIAIRSTQTLHDLHMAIQYAIGWDNDHLYAFFLYGKRNEDPDVRVVGPWEYEQDNAAGLPAHRLRIGMLGFVPRHSFLYLFDYGDNHEFEITVVGTEEQAASDGYPCIVDSRGQAPDQYDWADDEGQQFE